MKRFARRVDQNEDKIPAKSAAKTDREGVVSVDPAQAHILESQRLLGNQATIQLLRSGSLPNIQRGKPKGGSKSKSAQPPAKKEEATVKFVELLRDTVATTTIVVELDSHQNKHQTTLIPDFPTYTGEAGSKFPGNVNLAYHTTNFAPMVMNWAKKNIAAIKSKGALAAGKYDLDKDRTDFEVMARYYATDDEVLVDYHCNPNKNADLKKDFK